MKLYEVDELYKIIGKFNEISDNVKIGDGTIITNFCFIGKDVVIGKNCKIGNFSEINSGCIIGDNVLVNSHCHFNSNTVIGNNTTFGGNVHTADEKHMTPITKNITKIPCTIGNHVKVGQGSKLVCTRIEDYAVIGAGSIVLAKRVPSHEVWVGVPARKLRMTTTTEDELSDIR